MAKKIQRTVKQKQPKRPKSIQPPVSPPSITIPLRPEGRPAIGVFYNFARQTVIALECAHYLVKCLRITMDKGLHIIQIPEVEFKRDFQPCELESLERAARNYLGFSRYLGATDDAITHLQSLISLTPKEVEMAKAKAVEREQDRMKRAETVKTKTDAAKASSGITKVSASPAKVSATKSNVEKPSSPHKKSSPVSEKKERVTAAQMFQDLIMAGGLTDDEIFAKVQHEFGLDKKKRGYVAWYRNHLKKIGKNPPAEKK